MQTKKFHLFIFILVSIILLFEGFIYFFSYKIWYYNNFVVYGQTGFNPIIWKENGLIENLQSVFLFLSIINFVIIIKRLDKKILPKILNYFFYLYLFFLIYFLMEEISWGQHIFKWEANEFFKKSNHQYETNLHNISNLFNELPRSLLSIWCGLTFLIIKFFPKNNYKFNLYKEVCYPSKDLLKISILFLIFFVPDFFADLLNFKSINMNISIFHLTSINQWITSGELYYFFTFNFIKLSEYHELIFAYYILCHSYFLKANPIQKLNL